MSKETLLEKAASDSAVTPTKKKSAKKAAKKAAVKAAVVEVAVKPTVEVVAKPAAKKAAKAKVAAPVVEPVAAVEYPPAPESPSAPAKKKSRAKAAATPVEAPVVEAPAVVTPAVAVVVETPAEEPAKPKRPSRKKAKEDAPVVQAVVTEAAPVVVEPVAPVAEIAQTVPAPESAGDAEDESSDGEGEEPASGEEQRGGRQGDRAMPPAIASMGYTIASNGEWVHPSGRKLRWWERRKLERKARQMARAAGGAPSSGPSGGQPPRQEHQRQPQQQGGQQHPRHPQQQRQPQAEQFRDRDNDPDFDQPKPADLGPAEPCDGLLEIGPKGHGFIRLKDKGWNALPTDAFVHGDVIRKFGLREGMFIKGEQKRGPRGPQVTDVFTINGRKPEELRDLPIFEELKAINPNKRYQLETRSDRYTTRVIDMLTPVGRGQRGLIVSPPRAGKTTILHHIAEAITQNHPQVHLMILLVDERPEEVTEFKRSMPNAELFASSNDQDAKSHARIAQLAIERAKRLVEMGDQVFMLMDSITRLARAFNNLNKGGATMSGGMGVGAMEIPRRLFAAARNTRTAGFPHDPRHGPHRNWRQDRRPHLPRVSKARVIWKLVLDRKIAEQFIWPARQYLPLWHTP